MKFYTQKVNDKKKNWKEINVVMYIEFPINIKKFIYNIMFSSNYYYILKGQNSIYDYIFALMRFDFEQI